MLAFALLALLQQPVAPPTPAPPPAQTTPIAKVALQPAEAAVLVGDSLRLKAVAYDSAGRELKDVAVTWFQPGGHFEGKVDSTGLVIGGSTGTIGVSALVRAKTGGKAVAAVGRVTVLPQPASRIAVSPALKTLLVGQSLVLSAVPYAANDDRRYDEIVWSSDKPAVISVSDDGRITGRATGSAKVTAKSGRANWSQTVTVAANPITSVMLTPTESSVRTGDVVRLAFSAKGTGRTMTDLLPEYSVVGGGAQVDPDGAFVADKPGRYRVLATFAGRSAESVITVVPRDAIRPTTLVGRLPIKFLSAEFWLHPNGKYGYLTTISDRFYTIDVSTPSAPRITDSLVLDARVINDIMTTEDGKFGVVTREQASNRKNGIVVLSFEDPAHPKPIAEFTETVSGGVHSTYIYKGYVYLTDDATGSMRVIDIRDPYKPRQVARWETPRTSAGRTVHDIDVKDGLAYLSYWNDGLVVLDVGNGVKGGSPENPVLVSQYKYDLNALYRDVEAVGGPGFIRGTHTAWRAGKYVFVGDEVFGSKPRPTEGGTVLGLGRAYGRLHVIDVSDINAPKAVAYYEPQEGGTHNVWVAGDTLYLGDYQGGLRVLDISGELRGDLLTQGREIAHVVTGDKQGFTPNFANAWGAIYRDGLIYVPDVNSGLWIVKVDPKSELVP